MGVSRSPCSSRATAGRRLARRRTRAVAEPLPRDGRGPCEIAQRFRGVAITQLGVDPTAAQQSVRLRDTP